MIDCPGCVEDDAGDTVNPLELVVACIVTKYLSLSCYRKQTRILVDLRDCELANVKQAHAAFLKTPFLENEERDRDMDTASNTAPSICYVLIDHSCWRINFLRQDSVRSMLMPNPYNQLSTNSERQVHACCFCTAPFPGSFSPSRHSPTVTSRRSYQQQSVHTPVVARVIRNLCIPRPDYFP